MQSSTNRFSDKIVHTFDIKSYHDEDGERKFSGYANTFDHKDRAGDITQKGAFTKSIKEHIANGINHVLIDLEQSNIVNSIGASIIIELIEQLAQDFGANQVIASDIKLVLEGKNSGVEHVTLDVLDKEKLFKIIKDHNISEVYLLAAMLSAIAEKNSQLAWDLNMKVFLARNTF